MKYTILSLTLIFFTNHLFSQNVWDATTPTLTVNGNIGIGTIGVNTRFNINNTTQAHGLFQITSNALTATQYGIYNGLTSTSTTGSKFGFYNSINASTSSATYGIYSTSFISGSGFKHGVYSNVQGSGLGTGYGVYTTVSGSSLIKYGIYSTVAGSGTNNSSTDATTFGLYSQGTGANSRAGYFKGDVEINQGNSIYSAINGSKTLILQNAGAGDYAYTIAMNQTDHLYDWSFNNAFVLKRNGEMIKGCNTDNKIFSIVNYSSQNVGTDVFRVYGNGKVYATEINVQLTPFPDYVFKPDYHLMPLNEVRTFIKTNGHLPNVPTAQEVEAEGANLGEMTKTLVEKVEELTLYLLQQQDLINQQQERILLLESKIK